MYMLTCEIAIYTSRALTAVSANSPVTTEVGISLSITRWIEDRTATTAVTPMQVT